MSDTYYGGYYGGGGAGPIAPPPGATAAPRSVLENRVLSYLSETKDSPLGNLGNGSNSTVIVTTSDQIAKTLWEAACSFCRACYPVPATGIRTLASGATKASIRLNTIAVTTIEGALVPDGLYPRLWAVRQNGVSVNGKPLVRLAPGVFDAVYNRSSVWGTPKHYCRDGKTDVLRIGPPSDQESLTLLAEGYALPAPLGTLSGDVYGFSYLLPDDLALTAVCAHAAYLLCEQATDDVQLAARKSELIGIVNETRVREWGRLSEDRRKAHFGDNLVLLQSVAMGKK